MPFLILLFLVLTALPLPWPDPPFGWHLRGSLLATAAAVALPVAAAAGLARRTRRRLLSEPGHREQILRSYARGRLLSVLGLMAAHVLALTGLGWGWAVRTLTGTTAPEELPFGAELLVMAPFLLGLVLSWAGLYTAERTAVETSALGTDRPFGGRWGYVAFLARQHLAIVCVPLVLFVTEQGLVRALPERFQAGDTAAYYRLSLIGLVVLAVVLAPWPLRLILGARPLPAGPVRDRLEAAARRLRFRYSDVLLWDTRGGVANAMVAGPLPWVRYVFLSDRLLEELTPDEIEAVFGHEVGHVKHGHLLYYLAFMFLSLTTLAGLWVIGLHYALGEPEPVAAAPPPAAERLLWEPFGWEPVPEVPPEPVRAGLAAWREWEAVPAVLLAGAYVFVVFGFLSRRCERQADVYGCRAVSCGSAGCAGHAPGLALAPAGRGLCPTGIRTFISALDKVAVINGISRQRPGWLQAWLHASIARRVEFLEGLLTDERREPRFQRRLGLLKWGLLLGLAGVLGGLWLAGYGDAVLVAL